MSQETYRCKKQGCEANAWININGRWECHYYLTIAHFNAPAQPVEAPKPPQVPDLERMAEAVHNAYLVTCAKLGWAVKPSNQVPYADLTEDSKELDRASVRAVLAFVQPIEKLEQLGESPKGLEIIDQEKGWDGMPVRVRISNGTTAEWYFCKGHPMAAPSGEASDPSKSLDHLPDSRKAPPRKPLTDAQMEANLIDNMTFFGVGGGAAPLGSQGGEAYEVARKIFWWFPQDDGHWEDAANSYKRKCRYAAEEILAMVRSRWLAGSLESSPQATRRLPEVAELLDAAKELIHIVKECHAEGDFSSIDSFTTHPLSAAVSMLEPGGPFLHVDGGAPEGTQGEAEDCYGRPLSIQKAEGCKCFADGGLLMTGDCPVHGEAEGEAGKP